MTSPLQLPQEPCFDPNAFGMATLLGGLFVLGIASDMMLRSDDSGGGGEQQQQQQIARLIGYLGLLLLVISIFSFIYSFVRMCLLKVKSNDDDEYDQVKWPLLIPSTLPLPQNPSITTTTTNLHINKKPLL